MVGSLCGCHPEVKTTVTILAKAEGAQPVVLTVCDCDRRKCPTCQQYARPIGGNLCPNGHRF